MPYDKTVWFAGGAPGISAENLNNIESGIEAAHTAIDAATEAATANAIIKRDGAGRAKVAAPAAVDDIARKDTVLGLLRSIGATLVDWNTLATPGANSLNMGNAANGPGPAQYFHCVVLEYGTGGNVTQLAIPYGSSMTPGTYIRGRYSGVWTAWSKMWTDLNDGTGSGLDADKLDGLQPTTEATANTVMTRDASGRSKVAAPVAADHIARKDTVDAGVAAGLGSVWDAINAMNYDQYDLHMELYYTGHHGGPSIAGLTGMTFDGFMDTSRVDAPNTTASVSTTSMEVRVPTSGSTDVRPISAVQQYVAGLGNSLTVSNIGNCIDNDTATYASVYDDAPKEGTVVLDLGSAKVVSQLKWLAAVSASADNAWIGSVALSVDGVDWIVMEGNHANVCGNTTATWYTSAITPTAARYVAFEMKVDDDDSSGSSRINVYEVLVTTTVFLASAVLRATPKTLEEAAAEVTAYVSSQIPSGGGITVAVSADNGVHWENLTEESNRPDPQFSGFVERKHSKVLQYSGSSLLLRLTLTTPASRIATPVVKRYGLYWS